MWRMFTSKRFTFLGDSPSKHSVIVENPDRMRRVENNLWTFGDDCVENRRHFGQNIVEKYWRTGLFSDIYARFYRLLSHHPPPINAPPPSYAQWYKHPLFVRLYRGIFDELFISNIS